MLGQGSGQIPGREQIYPAPKSLTCHLFPFKGNILIPANYSGFVTVF
jgi:hypothetical protein